MSDSRLILRYNVLPAWIFAGFLMTVVVCACTLFRDTPMHAARTIVDVANFGIPGGFSVSHVTLKKRPMTCAECSCGTSCNCCQGFDTFTDPYTTQEYIIAGLLSALAAGVLLQVLMGRHTKLVVTNQGAAFPLLLSPGLLFRRTRKWDELGTLTLTRKLRRMSEDLDEHENIDNLLNFYFLSGGNATLKLTRFSEKDLKSLCAALNDWVSSSLMSPEVVALIKKTLNLEDAPLEADRDFTSMWEEDFQAHLGATTFVPLEKGATLQDGRFKIVTLMSSGGLSAVYLAETDGGRLVIVKESVIPLHVDEKTREKAKELFAREARLLMKLDHPAIAKVLDHIVEKGRDYLILEYVPGSSLRQLVRVSGPRSESDILAWGREIARTLAYLHALTPPIIHRDLTPDNLVLAKDGSVILIDFGAANEYEGAATGTLIGKQAYIAPEQFRGKAEPASDIYAFGCTLFFLLTGKDPEALSVSRPSKHLPGIASDIDDLIAACTEMEIERRLDSAEKLLQAIERISASRANSTPGGTSDR
ncbi:MAG TPA: serine/threonine-protein kinase [Candidatus Obscuribacterales bacterium]